MKSLLLLILVLCTPSVLISQTSKQIRSASPKIIFKHVKARHKQLKTEALNKIVYPLICNSDEPAKEIIIDFCPQILGPIEGKRGCDNEAQGKLIISVTFQGFPTKNTDGSSTVVWIEKNKNDSFDKDEYLRFSGLRRGNHPPKEGCASKQH